MKTRIFITLFGICCSLAIMAQEELTPAKVKAAEAAEVLRNWDKENLDTLDMEKLPKVVTGGLLINANISSYIISHHIDDSPFSSNMRIGGEFGGLLDFRVSKHFAIQAQLIFTAEQNRLTQGNKKNMLWSFGTELPVYFMGRTGNIKNGYFSGGAGVFTHFIYASNIDIYDTNGDKVQPQSQVVAEDKSLEDQLDSYLHANHSGLAAIFSYEFPFGMQILATYKVSLSDVFAFYKDNPETEMSLYPQKVTLGLAYRFR